MQTSIIYEEFPCLAFAGLDKIICWHATRLELLVTAYDKFVGLSSWIS